MKPRILIDDNIPYIHGRLEPVADVVYLDQFGFTPETIVGADAMIIRTRTKCDSELLEGSSVKAIATATIGTDQIDLPWCAGTGIKVTNSPGCNAPGVAQYVWSSLLHEGFDPRTQTLGIVGCGNVGSIVADWGRKLGCRVFVNDPYKQQEGVKDNYLSLEELLRTCDAVTLHTPLTKTGKYPTFYLIGERELGMMKPDAFFVNAARGAVVDNHALLKVIDNCRIRTIIDTWEGEPDLDRELLQRVNIGTFHIAGYSKQGKQRATRMVLESMEDFFGFKVSKDGLAGRYEPWNTVEAEGIMRSYDPYKDSLELKNAPHMFDTLRRNYNYRPEYKPE